MLNDITGLGGAAEKLISVCAEGIGAIARPVLIRRNADAKAYEIRKIAEATAESRKQLGHVKYEGGTVVVDSGSGCTSAEPPVPALEDRVGSRLAYQEAKRQANLESIIQNAANEMHEEDESSPERPDSDWTARFFRIAEDITTEQMQALWGKVLAGEVKRPGSYSLRTLDALKNISQKEAETFARVAPLAVIAGDKALVFRPDDGKFLEEKYGIRFTDILLLREAGLLTPADNLHMNHAATDKDTRMVFTCGTTCIMVDRPAGTPKQALPEMLFSDIGRELVSLIDRVPADPQYIRRFAEAYQIPGVIVSAGRVLQWNGDGSFQYADLHEIPGNKPKPGL